MSDSDLGERFCCNCKHSQKQDTLLGTGVYGEKHYWTCKLMRGRSVFKYGVCHKFKREVSP